MNKHIINLLNIEDDNIIITDIIVKGNIKEIHIKKNLTNEYCPLCNSKMHSKGIYRRTVNHPILQDGYIIKLIVSQRKWKCTNTQCNMYFNDQFNFISKYKQSSNITPYMILNEMKNINITTAEVARKYNVSDTTVHYIFMQYLDIKRLELPEILSVDEVYLNIDYKRKYALILFDFVTGEIVDILPNRWNDTTTPYFLSIDIEERRKVKYLVCDMYNPYINYTKRFFPNSIAIIDSYHVISWLNRSINIYINEVKKKYQARDKALYKAYLDKGNKESNDMYVRNHTPLSKEVYLLNNYRWIIMKSIKNIEYITERSYNRKLGMYMNTYDYEREFMMLDENFEIIRELKENYMDFNDSQEDDLEVVEKKLEELIKRYSECKISIFIEFSTLLREHRQEIINSFTYVTDENGKRRRISNGPIEGYNRIPKDLKRNARGFENFEYVRARLIWANRKKEPILTSPKSKSDVYRFNKKLKN